MSYCFAKLKPIKNIHHFAVKNRFARFRY